MRFFRAKMALALLCLATPALAQSPPGLRITAPAGVLPSVGIYCDDGTGKAAICQFGSGGSGGSGGTSYATSRINYVAIAAATGYAVGDQLERMLVTTPSTGAVVISYWVNTTQGTKLSAAPAAADIQLKQETITNTVFGATQSGAWNVGVNNFPTTFGVNNFPSAFQIAAGGLGSATAPVRTDPTGTTAQPITGSVTSYLPQLSTTDRGGTFGTTSAQLMPANASRHFLQVQVQSSSNNCYISGLTTATADYHSLLIFAGQTFESSSHVGTGAISIICTGANTPVFAREG